MRVLALEPYYGGSHRAFVDGWAAHSRHDWTLLTLEPFKWKWRMRHAAIDFAERIEERQARGERWDVLFCSDMLNLAELVGLVPAAVRDLPRVAYFHENQVTYPVRHAKARDYQFGLTNLTTCLAADAVWFNSEFHRRSFLDGLPGFLDKMPDYRPHGAIERVRARSSVEPLGIDLPPPTARPRPREAPMTVAWAARWEFDKDPESFFEAVRQVRARGVELRLNVLGESFRRVPPIFEQVREELAPIIDRWGYQESRVDYQEALAVSDVFVSTARHEFFGLSVVEAIAVGAYPLLPERLSYPEILGATTDDGGAEFLYRGGASALADRLELLAQRHAEGRLWNGDPDRARRRIERFGWQNRAPQLDESLAGVETRRAL